MKKRALFKAFLVTAALTCSVPLWGSRSEEENLFILGLDGRPGQIYQESFTLSTRFATPFGILTVHLENTPVKEIDSDLLNVSFLGSDVKYWNLMATDFARKMLSFLKSSPGGSEEEQSASMTDDETSAGEEGSEGTPLFPDAVFLQSFNFQKKVALKRSELSLRMIHCLTSDVPEHMKRMSDFASLSDFYSYIANWFNLTLLQEIKKREEACEKEIWSHMYL